MPPEGASPRDEVGQRRRPGYAQSTVSSAAPEFANQEQDTIGQCFSAGSHSRLRQAVPADISPDSVHHLRRSNMKKGRLGTDSSPRTWARLAQLWGGSFQDGLPHMPDEYDRQEEMKRQDRHNSVAMRLKIAPHGWRCTSQQKQLKQDPLLHAQPSREPFPYLGGDKDTELSTGQWLRSSTVTSTGSQWYSGSKGSVDKSSTASSFLVGRGKALGEDSRGSRMTLPTIIARLQRRLDMDWEGTMVVASVTDQDLVQVAFHLGSVDSERGVTAYMSVMAKDADLIGNTGLRKVSQLWGVKRNFSAPEDEMTDDLDQTDGDVSSPRDLENAWIFFLMAPKWVRMRATDAYYTAHPRAMGSTFRMSMAGSSVLLSLGQGVADDSQQEGATSKMDSEPKYSARKVTAARPQLNLIEQALQSMNGT